MEDYTLFYYSQLAIKCCVVTTKVNAAQGLLKQQCSHMNGFQNVVLGFTLFYDVQTEEFIQVLHAGCGHCMDDSVNSWL